MVTTTNNNDVVFIQVENKELNDWKEDAERLAEWALEIYNATTNDNLKTHIGQDIIAHYELVKKYQSD